MFERRRLLTPGLLIAVALAVIIAACGGNPTSPSSTTGGGNTNLSTGISGTGPTGTFNGPNTGNGNGSNGNGNGNGSKGSNGVVLHGIVSAVSGSCPTLTFTANGVTVKTTAQTVFHGVGCANLKVGGRVEVKGPTQTDGIIAATWVTVNGEDGDEGDDNESELKGMMSGLGGTCPALTFKVNGVTVKTTAQTEFKEIGCAQLQNGMTVEVEGSKGSDGTVTAMKVEAEYSELTGMVSALSGTCPTVTFTVNGTTVTTTAQTMFKDGACSAVKAGMKVEVKGLKQSNGSIVATMVDVDD